MCDCVTCCQPDDHSGTESSSESQSVTAVQSAALTRRYLTFSAEIQIQYRLTDLTYTSIFYNLGQQSGGRDCIKKGGGTLELINFLKSDFRCKSNGFNMISTLV